GRAGGLTPARRPVRRPRRLCPPRSPPPTAATRLRAAPAFASPELRRSRRYIRPAERRFHFAAHLDGEIVLIVGDVAPFQAFAFADVAHEPHAMREAQRQQLLRKRALRRKLLAPDAEAAFTVEHLALLERALGGRGDVGAKAGRRAGRLLA